MNEKTSRTVNSDFPAYHDGERVLLRQFGLPVTILKLVHLPNARTRSWYYEVVDAEGKTYLMGQGELESLPAYVPEEWKASTATSYAFAIYNGQVYTAPSHADLKGELWEPYQNEDRILWGAFDKAKNIVTVYDFEYTPKELALLKQTYGDAEIWDAQWPDPPSRIAANEDKPAFVYDPDTDQLYTGGYHRQIFVNNPEITEKAKANGPKDAFGLEPFSTSLVLGLYNRWQDNSIRLMSDYGKSTATPEQKQRARELAHDYYFSDPIQPQAHLSGYEQQLEAGTQPIELMLSADWRSKYQQELHREPGRLAFAFLDGTLYIGVMHRDIVRNMKMEGLPVRDGTLFGWIDPRQDGTEWSTITHQDNQDSSLKPQLEAFFQQYPPSVVMNYARTGQMTPDPNWTWGGDNEMDWLHQSAVDLAMPRDGSGAPEFFAFIYDPEKDVLFGQWGGQHRVLGPLFRKNFGDASANAFFGWYKDGRDNASVHGVTPLPEDVNERVIALAESKKTARWIRFTRTARIEMVNFDHEGFGGWGGSSRRPVLYDPATDTAFVGPYDSSHANLIKNIPQYAGDMNENGYDYSDKEKLRSLAYAGVSTYHGWDWESYGDYDVPQHIQDEIFAALKAQAPVQSKWTLAPDPIPPAQPIPPVKSSGWRIAQIIVAPSPHAEGKRFFVGDGFGFLYDSGTLYVTRGHHPDILRSLDPLTRTKVKQDFRADIAAWGWSEGPLDGIAFWSANADSTHEENAITEEARNYIGTHMDEIQAKLNDDMPIDPDYIDGMKAVRDYHGGKIARQPNAFGGTWGFAYFDHKLYMGGGHRGLMKQIADDAGEPIHALTSEGHMLDLGWIIKESDDALTGKPEAISYDNWMMANTTPEYRQEMLDAVQQVIDGHVQPYWKSSSALRNGLGNESPHTAGLVMVDTPNDGYGGGNADDTYTMVYIPKTFTLYVSDKPGASHRSLLRAIKNNLHQDEDRWRNADIGLGWIYYTGYGPPEPAVAKQNGIGFIPQDLMEEACAMIANPRRSKTAAVTWEFSGFYFLDDKSILLGNPGDGHTHVIHNNGMRARDLKARQFVPFQVFYNNSDDMWVVNAGSDFINEGEWSWPDDSWGQVKDALVESYHLDPNRIVNEEGYEEILDGKTAASRTASINPDVVYVDDYEPRSSASNYIYDPISNQLIIGNLDTWHRDMIKKYIAPNYPTPKDRDYGPRLIAGKYLPHYNDCAVLTTGNNDWALAQEVAEYVKQLLGTTDRENKTAWFGQKNQLQQFTYHAVPSKYQDMGSTRGFHADDRVPFIVDTQENRIYHGQPDSSHGEILRYYPNVRAGMKDDMPNPETGYRFVAGEWNPSDGISQSFRAKYLPEEHQAEISNYMQSQFAGSLLNSSHRENKIARATMFHATSPEYVESILRDGLLQSKNGQDADDAGWETNEGIYFFESFANAQKIGMYKYGETVVLSVDVDGIPIQLDPDFIPLTHDNDPASGARNVTPSFDERRDQKEHFINQWRDETGSVRAWRTFADVSPDRISVASGSLTLMEGKTTVEAVAQQIKDRLKAWDGTLEPLTAIRYAADYDKAFIYSDGQFHWGTYHRQIARDNALDMSNAICGHLVPNGPTNGVTFMSDGWNENQHMRNEAMASLTQLYGKPVEDMTPDMDAIRQRYAPSSTRQSTPNALGLLSQGVHSDIHYHIPHALSSAWMQGTSTSDLVSQVPRFGHPIEQMRDYMTAPINSYSRENTARLDPHPTLPSRVPPIGSGTPIFRSQNISSFSWYCSWFYFPDSGAWLTEPGEGHTSLIRQWKDEGHDTKTMFEKLFLAGWVLHDSTTDTYKIESGSDWVDAGNFNLEQEAYPAVVKELEDKYEVPASQIRIALLSESHNFSSFSIEELDHLPSFDCTYTLDPQTGTYYVTDIETRHEKLYNMLKGSFSREELGHFEWGWIFNGVNRVKQTSSRDSLTHRVADSSDTLDGNESPRVSGETESDTLPYIEETKSLHERADLDDGDFIWAWNPANNTIYVGAYWDRHSRMLAPYDIDLGQLLKIGGGTGSYNRSHLIARYDENVLPQSVYNALDQVIQQRKTAAYNESDITVVENPDAIIDGVKNHTTEGHDAVIYDALTDHLYICPDGHHRMIRAEFPHLRSLDSNLTGYYESIYGGPLRPEWDDPGTLDNQARAQELYDEWFNSEFISNESKVSVIEPQIHYIPEDGSLIGSSRTPIMWDAANNTIYVGDKGGTHPPLLEAARGVRMHMSEAPLKRKDIYETLAAGLYTPEGTMPDYANAKPGYVEWFYGPDVSPEVDNAIIDYCENKYVDPRSFVRQGAMDEYFQSWIYCPQAGGLHISTEPDSNHREILNEMNIKAKELMEPPYSPFVAGQIWVNPEDQISRLTLNSDLLQYGDWDASGEELEGHRYEPPDPYYGLGLKATQEVTAWYKEHYPGWSLVDDWREVLTRMAAFEPAQVKWIGEPTRNAIWVWHLPSNTLIFANMFQTYHRTIMRELEPETRIRDSDKLFLLGEVDNLNTPDGDLVEVSDREGRPYPNPDVYQAVNEAYRASGGDSLPPGHPGLTSSTQKAAMHFHLVPESEAESRWGGLPFILTPEGRLYVSDDPEQHHRGLAKMLGLSKYDIGTAGIIFANGEFTILWGYGLTNEGDDDIAETLDTLPDTVWDEGYGLEKTAVWQQPNSGDWNGSWFYFPDNDELFSAAPGRWDTNGQDHNDLIHEYDLKTKLRNEPFVAGWVIPSETGKGFQVVPWGSDWAGPNDGGESVTSRVVELMNEKFPGHHFTG